MADFVATRSFHASSDAKVAKMAWPNKSDQEFTYTFSNFFHPFVNELIECLNDESLPGLFDPVFQRDLATEFFDQFYTRPISDSVKIEDDPKDIDLRMGGPYAIYNWELFFHIPLTIAVHLSKNQRFAEAQRWFHFIFDPTCTDAASPAPRRFWKFLAFRDAANPTQIDELLALLSKPTLTPGESELRDSILDGYASIKEDPFQPHKVARTRQIAYQYHVVMKYLDNLIAWGDHLFRQDTIESINEATQRYVLAANLLGARPQRVPRSGTIRPQTFAQLKERVLDATSNVLVEMEGEFPLDLGLPQTEDDDPDAAGPLFGMGRSLYFCIPRNDKLLGYWDTVADRLFKIRNCLNIEGVVRQLPLFDPPIDPGMLVKAAAAGIDIGSIVSGLNRPTSLVRAPIVIQKALELCAEVRGLGSALLAAIEKGEGEHLARLRQGHEIKIEQLQQEVQFLQWQAARESTEALVRGRDSMVDRYRYYQHVLGLPVDDANAPERLALDHAVLTEENFDEVYSNLVGQYDQALTLTNYQELALRDQGTVHLDVGEYEELNGSADRALAARISAAAAEQIAQGLSAIPGMSISVTPFGVGVGTNFPIGQVFANVGRAVSGGFNISAQVEDRQGQIASKTSFYARRADDWTLQRNLAARDLMQVGRQIIGSLIAVQIAHHEYETAQKKIEQSQEVDQYLREKFSNEELYAWMRGEISRLYYEYYRFAFDTARKAEQTMKRELLRPELDATEFVKFNYWDTGRRGLLSGEALYLDVKRMEAAYYEHNKREYELVRHVSLLQVDPLALLKLRATGSCTVSLPEAMFVMDGPSHYCRRIKSVALTIPSVAGPYTSVNCTVTLLRSSIRRSPSVGDGYARAGTEDLRFVDCFGSLQSIVTSSGQNDSGLFEANLSNEQYLPFENQGLDESVWQFELSADPSKGEATQVDPDSISDVIMHVRYKAREGGAALRTEALKYLGTLMKTAQAPGSIRLFSVRHEFPTEWAAFQAQGQGDNKAFELALNLREEHYPFWSKDRLDSVVRVEVVARGTKDRASINIYSKADMSSKATKADTLSRNAMGNLLTGTLSGDPDDATSPGILLPQSPLGELKLYFEDRDVADVWIAVAWTTTS